MIPDSAIGRRHRGGVALALVVLLMAACAGRAPASGSSPGGPSGSGVGPRSLPALQLAVLVAIGGKLAYCDPDEFPVPRGDPLESARARLGSIRKDRAAFAAILSYLHLRADQRFTPEQIVRISDLSKQMRGIQLQPSGTGYRFTVLVPARGSGGGTEVVTGTVSRSGAVRIGQRRTGKQPMCPICLARGDMIATPGGEVPVQDVTVGMPVWTTGRDGRRILAVVLETGHMQAPPSHRVIQIRLADGRTVVASPGHPTADGRTIGELRPGERLDASVVVFTESFLYSGGETFDLLPSGPTGTYYVNGILLGSTLTERESGPTS